MKMESKIQRKADNVPIPACVKFSDKSPCPQVHFFAADASSEGIDVDSLMIINVDYLQYLINCLLFRLKS